MGLDCTAGECRLVRSYDPVNTNKLRFITPDNANIRTEVFMFGYGFAKLKAGATLLENLRMDLVTARSGLKLEGSFAPPTSQLAPADSDYKSDYKLSFLTEVVAGSLNKAGDSAFRKLLLKLGVFQFNLLKFQTSIPLATSPKGTATRDKETFADGDTLGFSVSLDPATVQFPFVGYNVSKVKVMRSLPGQPAKEVASVAASDGQTKFDLSWVVEGTFGQVEAEFFAFVETRLPTPFDLELAKVGAAPPALAGTFSLVQVVNQPLTAITFGDATKEEIRVTGEVEQIGLEFAVCLKKNASYSSRHDRVTLERNTGVCAFLRTDTETTTLAGTSSVATDQDGISLSVTGNTWKLSGLGLLVPATGTVVKSRVFTDVVGDCGGLNTSNQSSTKAITSGDNGLGNVGTPIFAKRPSGSFITGLEGPVTVGADGKREIRFDGSPVSPPDRTLVLTMDLRERPSSRATTDVALELIAPASAAPDSALTYAVNLVDTEARSLRPACAPNSPCRPASRSSARPAGKAAHGRHHHRMHRLPARAGGAPCLPDRRAHAGGRRPLRRQGAGRCLGARCQLRGQPGGRHDRDRRGTLTAAAPDGQDVPAAVRRVTRRRPGAPPAAWRSSAWSSRLCRKASSGCGRR